jgi:hypothetical protein
LLVASAMFLVACGADGGATTKEKVVDTYLKALETRDTEALEGLLHQDAKADRAIRRLIRMHGGRRFKRASITYLSYDDVYEAGANCSENPPGTGGLGAAVVRAHGFVHRVYLGVANDRCYLLFGARREAAARPRSAHYS